jgi:lysophospholipase L1-like esterase
VALLASLGANFAAFRIVESLQRHEQEVRLDPLGLGASAEAQPAPGTKPVFVLFGDSRVAMWEAPGGLDGYAIRNLGIGRQTTAQALLRLKHEVPPLHPRVVLLEIGVNDLRTLPMFPERRAAIVEGCKLNLARMVREVRDMGATVVLTTIFSLGDVPIWRRVDWTPGPVADAIVEVNAFLRTLAGDGVVVFESGAVLDDPPGKVREAFQFDYLHENAAAYAAMNARLASLVASASPQH